MHSFSFVIFSFLDHFCLHLQCQDFEHPFLTPLRKKLHKQTNEKGTLNIKVKKVEASQKSKFVDRSHHRLGEDKNNRRNQHNVVTYQNM